jgi:VIT1/CCC1 family predicted Fe2+/Mn2+ transporter
MTTWTQAAGHGVPRHRAFTNRLRAHSEQHRSARIGWLRAAVLGAIDGIVSTASLVLGVASAGADHRTVLLSSISGLIAGAMSMAAGEFG